LNELQAAHRLLTFGADGPINFGGDVARHRLTCGPLASRITMRGRLRHPISDLLLYCEAAPRRAVRRLGQSSKIPLELRCNPQSKALVMSPVIAVIALGAMVAARGKRCALQGAPAKLQKPAQ
jgi:hypothetical protein